ncbi:MAG: universal stress protein [Proteobacteria bacterium]|nr:universal stress protein [Pseudomonadota bacterium]
MRAIHRILVAVKDPAAKTLPAVDKAAQLARAFGARLELFHAISTPLYVDAYSPALSIPQIERTTRNDNIEQLEKVARKLRARGGLDVDVSASWDFPVYEAIMRRAAHQGADLIVAERHAKAHVTPGLLQLTDWELLRTSTLPVLLVKTPAPYRRSAVLAAVDPEHTFSKPETLDREILAVASTLAKALHGPLHAVNAFNSFPLQFPPSRHMSDAVMRQMAADARRAAKQAFERTTATARIPKSRCHLIARPPIDAIEQTARKTHSSIVVMGAIARSGVQRFFFGNTAEALLDSLDCDMLIVKPPGFAPRVQKRTRGVRFAALPYLPGI